MVVTKACVIHKTISQTSENREFQLKGHPCLALQCRSYNDSEKTSKQIDESVHQLLLFVMHYNVLKARDVGKPALAK